MSSCFEQGDCQNQTSNQIRVAFFSAANQKSIKLQLDSVFVSGLSGKFIENKELEALVLPLDPLKEACVITLYQPGVVSTISIGYQARTTILDPACGATDLFTLKQADGEGIVSASIVQDLISVALTTNVRVYF